MGPSQPKVLAAIVLAFVIFMIFRDKLPDHARLTIEVLLVGAILIYGLLAVKMHQPTKRIKPVPACKNKDSPITLANLKRPNLQIPPGHCYEEGDVRYILQSNKKILSNIPPTLDERDCMEHFLREKSINTPSCTRANAFLH
jgi:hypothetical protein